MSQIKLPQLRATLTIEDNPYQGKYNHPWTQINPSCLLAYLGVRGYGMVTGNAGTATKLSSVRTFELTGDVKGSITSDLAIIS